MSRSQDNRGQVLTIEVCQCRIQLWDTRTLLESQFHIVQT